MPKHKKKKKKYTKIVELVIGDEALDMTIDAISLVTNPAIEENFVYMNKAKNNLTLAKQDEEKRIIISPALIPNKQIFRYDADKDQEYYVYFSKETVKKASELYLKHNNHHSATYEHEKNVDGVYTVESWVKTGDSDKSKNYGYDLPLGTWFVSMKIENEDIWNEIKKGETIKGLSIEGYFVERMEKMSKQVTDDDIRKAYKELVKEGKIKVDLSSLKDFDTLFKKVEKQIGVAEGKGLTDLRKAVIKADTEFLKLSRMVGEALEMSEKLIKVGKELGIDLTGELQGKINVLKSADDTAEYWVKELNADQYR